MNESTDAKANPKKLQEVDSITLLSGRHSPDHEFCLLELAAYLADEPHSDHPKCVSPVLAQFGRQINDRLNDADRQILKPLAFEWIGTYPATMKEELDRMFTLVDWAVRRITPMALDIMELKYHANKLRDLPEIVDKETAKKAHAAAAADIATYAAAAKSKPVWTKEYILKEILEIGMKVVSF